MDGVFFVLCEDAGTLLSIEEHVHEPFPCAHLNGCFFVSSFGRFFVSSSLCGGVFSFVHCEVISHCG